MSADIASGLLIGLIVSFFGSTGLIWRKLGQLENAVKKSCPFGKCPVFERAKEEAAPDRSMEQRSQ